MVAPCPQPQAGHTLWTSGFLGVDQGLQSLPRAVAPHPLVGSSQVLKSIPSSETTQCRWAIPVPSSAPPPSSCAFTVSFQDSGLWNGFRPYQALVWVPFLTSASLSDSASQVASLDPPTDLRPHFFLCPLSLKVQDFLGSSGCC